MSKFSYHRRRELVEEGMAAKATTAVARIVHDKLAMLHGESAARAVAAAVYLAEGTAPLPQPAEL